MSARFGRFARSGLACIVALAAAGSASRAAETGFIDRFEGAWAGSGKIEKDGGELQFNCNATATPKQNHIIIQGNCRAFIGSRDFAADLTFDPASGRYVGTYIGHKIGPARLSGERNGNVVDLTITWPKPVNGDMTARMVVENAGKGILKITFADNFTPGGPVTRTAFVLAQS